MLVATHKERIVTRYLGGLTAMQNRNVQMVIWARSLARPIKEELCELSSIGLPSSEFVTLASDPVERIQHQLGKSRIKSHFLVHDIALLVTVFGELSQARRIRVSLVSRSEGGRAFSRGESDLTLICAYTGGNFRAGGASTRSRRDSGGHVTLFRPASVVQDEFPVSSGLHLHLEAAPSARIPGNN